MAGKKEGCSYIGEGKLLPNYGWVQNTSSLSMVRDMLELIDPEGINHYEFMRRVYAYRIKQNPELAKWSYDARCRARAICATGMADIDRNIQGYVLTSLGKELLKAPKSDRTFNGDRILCEEEKAIFRKGLLTNPPVIRVLTLLNNARRDEHIPLSKYDVGAQLGFVGDEGFTHFEAEYVATNGGSFNDKEGSADKWARTIISWLTQVGWARKEESIKLYGQRLPVYTTTQTVDRILQYAARSTVKNIPQEMLCSDVNPLSVIIQKRRCELLDILSNIQFISAEQLQEKLQDRGIETDEETIRFDVINLVQAGINIKKEGNIYKLADNVKLDKISETESKSFVDSKLSSIELNIQHYVSKYDEIIPPRLIDNLIRFGSSGRNKSTEFEIAVNRFFLHMGYESEHLGQGNGRVADVIAKYKDSLMPKSYGLIIDAKAYEKYNFPAGDVRKMKEYIKTHMTAMMQDMIPQYAFVFVSMDFVDPDKSLEEIANDTAVNGTAIDVYRLLALGADVKNQKTTIASMYEKFITNKRFEYTV